MTKHPRPARGTTQPTTAVISLVAIFALALLPRLAYVLWRWSSLPDWNVDAIGYHQLAINLIERGVFSLNTDAPFLPDGVRTPGYPIVIAAFYTLFGHEPRLVLLGQIVADSITAVLVVLLARRLTQSPCVALWAGVLYALNPLCWRYCAELYVESLLAGMIALILLLLIHVEHATARQAIPLALVAAATLLFKPAVWTLPVILLVVWVWQHKMKQALTLAAVCMVVIAPWLVRNLFTFGRPMLSQVFENNLVTVSAPATLAEAKDEPVVPWSPNWQDHFFELVVQATQAEPALMNIPEHQMTNPQRDQAQQLLARIAREVIVQHPGAFIRSHLRGVALALLPREHQFWFSALAGKSWDVAVPGGMWVTIWHGDWQATSRLARLMWVVGWAACGVSVLSAIRGGWYVWRVSRTWSVVVGCFGLYLIVLPGPIAYERFYVPLVPLFCVLIGVGLGKCLRFGVCVVSGRVERRI